MIASRRLAAVLAADVVGYSLLMGEDEAGTARAVRERRGASTPIVAGHGDRIVKTTGDSLLVESISRFRASAPTDNPTEVAGRERIIDGLRKAGGSEGMNPIRLLRANAALPHVAVRRRNQRN